jgi:hypothetical protein
MRCLCTHLSPTGRTSDGTKLRAPSNTLKRMSEVPVDERMKNIEVGAMCVPWWTCCVHEFVSHCSDGLVSHAHTHTGLHTLVTRHLRTDCV